MQDSSLGRRIKASALVLKIVCGVAGYARIYPDILLVLFGQDAL